MRILVIALAFALASCGGDETANTAAVTEEGNPSELATVNDLTAIDAATGQAADMAADVNYMLDENEFGGDDNSANASANESR